MGERKYYEDDHVEIPEEYLNMSVEELREKKDKIGKQRLKNLKMAFDVLDEVQEKSGINFHFAPCDDTWFKYYFELQTLGAQEPTLLAELFREQDVQTQNDTISSLKKRIKYCKNPLEKRDLEQQLNQLYKERKKKYD